MLRGRGSHDELEQDASGASTSSPTRRSCGVYDCDGLTGWRALPALVVLPGSTEEVQAVVRACHREGVPFVARGAGTGLSGGALPVADGVVISLARMTRILEIDLDEPARRRRARRREPRRHARGRGGRLLLRARPVEPAGLHDRRQRRRELRRRALPQARLHRQPRHRARRVVLPDGELVELGGKSAEPHGPRPARRLRRLGGDARDRDARSRCASSARRRPWPPCSPASASTDAAGARRLGRHRGRDPPVRDRDDGPAHDRGRRGGRRARLPGGRRRRAARRARRGRRAGRRGHGRRRGALPARAAPSRSASPRDEAERALLWKGRKSAFAAMGRISTDYYVQDGVVPRTQLPAVLRRIDGAVEREHGLRVGNVFHAGDGNLHPLVLYDAAAGEGERATRARRGDPRRLPRRRRLAHGRARRRRRQGVLDAADVLRARPRGRSRGCAGAFDPDGIANPGKVLPTPRLCGEVPGPYRAHPLERIGRCRASLASRRLPALLAARRRRGPSRADRRRPDDRRARPHPRARGRAT